MKCCVVSLIYHSVVCTVTEFMAPNPHVAMKQNPRIYIQARTLYPCPRGISQHGVCLWSPFFLVGQLIDQFKEGHRYKRHFSHKFFDLLVLLSLKQNNSHYYRDELDECFPKFSVHKKAVLKQILSCNHRDSDSVSLGVGFFDFHFGCAPRCC